MRTVLQRRPPASMVVSLVALVVAMSGTAVAAGKLVSGDKLIRKGTLSGNRLRRHTLTGTQINVKKLGTVPRAKQATSAGSAGYAARAGSAASAASASTAANATNAANAANATNAANAAALGGRAASGYLTTDARIGTNGVVSIPGTTAGNTVTLLSHGPFTVTMTCTLNSSRTDTALSLDASTSESGSVIDGETGAPANASTQIGSVGSTASTPAPQFDSFSFEAPDGTALIFSGSFDVNSLGSQTKNCWAALAGIT